MEHSLRLKKFYDGKRSFSITKRAKLSEMASYDAVSADFIPDDPGAKRDFATEHLTIATNAMAAFDNIARECGEVQDHILELARYSSFLDQIVPYKPSQVTQRVTTARDLLCKQRTLFVESLVNDDLVSSRTVASANGIFTEISNFDQFLRIFGEFMTASNLTDNPTLSDEVLQDYKTALNDYAPGAILALVIGADESVVFEQQVKLINEMRAQGATFTQVDTELNVLCWPIARSYLDLPSRLLAKAGMTPTYDLERILAQVEAISELTFSEEAHAGLNYLAEWALIIRNGMINVLALTRIFVRLLDATLNCLWEFFFFQLEQLEEREEFEVLESVLVMAQQTLFEESVQ
jgi:hypothetical protein